MLAKVTQITLMVVVLFAALITGASVDPRRQINKRSTWRKIWSKIDVNDFEAKAAAGEAVLHLEGVRNSAMAYRLLEVESAKNSWYRNSPTNMKVMVRIGHTDCIRQIVQRWTCFFFDCIPPPVVNLENCSTVEVERCLVTANTFFNIARIKTIRCGKDNGTEGEMVVDEEDDEVMLAAEFATKEMTSRANGRYSVNHPLVLEATSQVVDGYMYRVKIDVDVTTNDPCKAETAKCTVKVWDQAGRTPRYTLEDYTCNHLIS